MPEPSSPPDRPPDDGVLAPLLQVLAETLDVREIFARISAEARRIVPHDFLMLGLIAGDREHIRVLALSGDMPPGVPTEVTVPDPLRFAIEYEAFVLNDMKAQPGGRTVAGRLRTPGKEPPRTVEAEVQPLFHQLVQVRGLRSFMRVIVRLRGGVLGGLVFCSTSPDAYGDSDVARARQIASCVALALSHQRLAEEEQRSAEARERADRLEERVSVLARELETLHPHRALGRSRKWKEVLAQATKVAPTDTTVMISGESGTGKEVVARFIHRGSPRKDGPFVALNCAALPEQLLESELFGHEKGAFTGALNARPGRIEQASGGVLFLDEVAEMSPPVQAKFLRVLQEREYQRLGGARTLKADVRVLAATNRNLKDAIARGAFREDLYYRLAVFDIALPPLRERPEDVALLVEAFLEEIGQTVGRPAAGVSQEVKDKLVAYAWPGNVRELRNALERAVILCEGGLITSEHLPTGIASDVRPGRAAPDAGPPPPGNLGSLEAAERGMIVEALSRAGNNKSKAARLLGLTRAQLRSRIEKHGLGAER